MTLRGQGTSREPHAHPGGLLGGTPGARQGEHRQNLACPHTAKEGRGTDKEKIPKAAGKSMHFLEAAETQIVSDFLSAPMKFREQWKDACKALKRKLKLPTQNQIQQCLFCVCVCFTNIIFYLLCGIKTGEGRHKS